MTLSLADGGVSTAKIANGAVTAPKIAAGAVGNAALAADSVSSFNVVPGSLRLSDLLGVSQTLQVDLSTFTVSARSCVAREYNQPDAQVGDMIIVIPNPNFPYPAGTYTVPTIVEVEGKAGVFFCNGTSSDITSSFSFRPRRIRN